MRHLSTEELLLYANGELADRDLCHHVAECVDCKSDLVDIQESYVLAAAAVQEELPVPAPSYEQVAKFRTRLAAESQLRNLHLSTEDLLLSIEGGLSPELEAHLANCSECQDRAADMQVQLAAIEFEMQREAAFDLPVVRRAAILAELRGRLEQEIESQRRPKARGWDWVPRIPARQILAGSPYAAAFAGICLALWLGWNVTFFTSAPAVPEPAAVARLTEVVAAPASAAVPASRPAKAEDLPGTAPPEHFALASSHSVVRPGSPVLRVSAPPPVRSRPALRQVVPVSVPRLDSLPEPPGLSPEVLAQSAPRVENTLPTLAQASPEALAEGSWMLIKAGLWKANMQIGGTARSIRFVGSVASERERAQAERALLAAADGRPVEFDIAVRRSSLAASVAPAAMRATRTRSLGTAVRNSLLQHYRDAARRSFRPLERSLLENELDLYVSDVMQNDADLLAHVHALHQLLSRSAVGRVRTAGSFRRAARYHLDAIARHRAAIYGQLAEALPRRYWAYRGPRAAHSAADDLAAAGTALLEDALGLDRALSALFFAGRGLLDASEGSPSSASLLARLQQRTRQLRSAIR